MLAIRQQLLLISSDLAVLTKAYNHCLPQQLHSLAICRCDSTMSLLYFNDLQNLGLILTSSSQIIDAFVFTENCKSHLLYNEGDLWFHVLLTIPNMV